MLVSGGIETVRDIADHLDGENSAGDRGLGSGGGFGYESQCQEG